MNPGSSRWKSTESRRARSATFWKVFVAGACGAALSAVVVVSCLDDGRREHAWEQEVAVVETTAAVLPTTRPSWPEGSRSDYAPSSSTSRVVVTARADEATSRPAADVVLAPVEVTVAAPTVAESPPGPLTSVSTSEPQPFELPLATRTNPSLPGDSASPVEVAPPVAPAVVASPAITPASTPTVLRDARGNVIDPANHGTNPNAPAMSAGAGQFKTDAPPWAASAFTSDLNGGAGRFTTDAPPSSASSFESNPNAGAGPFTTEWNIPGYGY